MPRRKVEHFDDFAVRHRLVGIEGDELRGVLLLRELQERQELVAFDGLRLGVAKRGKELLVFVDIDFRAGLDDGLLRTLRQLHFQGSRKDKGGGDYKEYKEQENDIGHRSHAERIEYAVLSF